MRQNAELAWLTLSGRGWKLHGTLQTQYVWSPALHQKRRVLVYLPAGYKRDPGHRYPVLYLLHGSPGTLDDWLRYGRAPQDAERLWTRGRMPETILVLPDGQGIGYLGDSEYLDAPNGRGRPGANVGTFLWRDLVTWVDGHYRTVASPAGRILCGVSSGGYGAVNLGLQHPDVFGRLYSFSGYFEAEDSGWARPVWGYHPQTERLARESPLRYVPVRRDPRWARTFIVMVDGEGERPPYPEQARAFDAVLTQAGIAHVSRTLHGRHSWDLWRTALRDTLTGQFDH